MATIKDLKRMCKSYQHCNSYPLCFDGVMQCRPCYFSDNTEKVIDKWIEEHPVKTYAMDFFEKFPNAARGEKGTPNICQHQIYPEIYADYRCYEDCLKCWNREMEENV